MDLLSRINPCEVVSCSCLPAAALVLVRSRSTGLAAPAGGKAARGWWRYIGSVALRGTTFTNHRVLHVTGAPSEDRLTALRAFFNGLLEWAGITPHVRTNNPRVIARLHEDPVTGARVLWALNPTSTEQRADLLLDGAPNAHTTAQPLWPSGAAEMAFSGARVSVTIGGRDAIIARLVTGRIAAS